MSEKAFQEYWPHNDCWGCGAGNEHGLRIKSYWCGENSTECEWQPSEHHKAGPDGFLNGGIIGAIIDCHTVCTAIADSYRQEGRALDSKPPLWCVTASMKIDYHSPVKLSEPVKLVANILKREGRKILIECELFSGEQMCVRGEVLAIKVPAEKWYG